MDNITLTFPKELNVSLQNNTDDIVYFLDTDGTKRRIGPCTNISGNTITCTTEAWRKRPTTGSYIFFGKENIINSSGLAGYYAEVEMENTSTEKKELFAVNSEIFLSSN
jgi:hypothetical protein